MTIDAFCNMILKSRIERFKAWYAFCYKCRDLNVSGNVSPDVLSKIIVKAKHSKMMQDLLIPVLWHADGNSISEDNFKKIMRFKLSVRVQLLDPIEHIEDIAMYQLMEINRDRAGGWETFDGLINIMCTYDCFTEADIVKMVNENIGMDVEEKKCCLKEDEPYFGDNRKYLAAVEAVNTST